jgi:hypothetical protein
MHWSERRCVGARNGWHRYHTTAQSVTNGFPGIHRLAATHPDDDITITTFSHLFEAFDLAVATFSVELLDNDLEFGTFERSFNLRNIFLHRDDVSDQQS